MTAWIDWLRSIHAVLSGSDRFVVVHGDCLAVLALLPGRIVDHILTDPPYEAEAHTKRRRLRPGTAGPKWKRRGGQTVQPEPELVFDCLTEESRTAYGLQIARLARRWALVFCQVEASKRWADALHPLVYKRTCVWVKPDAMPQLTGDRPGMGYESIVAAHATGRSRWNGGGRNGVFVHMKDVGVGAGIRNEHPTTKPQGLMCELVTLFTNPGDIILDPFAGSGSTGVAALRLGRRCILIERDATYAKLARERCEAECGGQDVVHYRAGQETLFR